MTSNRAFNGQSVNPCLAVSVVITTDITVLSCLDGLDCCIQVAIDNTGSLYRVSSAGRVYSMSGSYVTLDTFFT